MAPTRTHYKLDRHNYLAKQPVDLADDLVRVRNCYRDGQNIHMNRNDTQKPRRWVPDVSMEGTRRRQQCRLVVQLCRSAGK